MTQENRTTLKAGYAANLEDSGANTAAELRTELTDIADSAFIILTDDSDDITEGSTNLFMTSAERTKLTGVETGATADQTGAEIKAAYEAEADTNAFTDADHTKLDGIAASATANPNALDNVAEDTTPQLGGALDGNGETISNFENEYKNETGTTYAPIASDRGKILTFNNASAITVTVPNNLPIGWTITAIQLGAGQVTFAAGTGATINNRSSELKIAGQYGMVTLTVYANSGGTSAVCCLAGDTAS